MINETREGKVELPSSYFSKGKLEYNNWKTAWFREAIQNSSDAGATQIDFEINQDQENQNLLRVVCKDNGKGMDEETLINVFLSLGGSKKDEGATGGFGYAKVLLAFAHERYRIRTRNVLCKGAGGDYTLSEKADHHEGVELEVLMDRSDVSEWELKHALDTIVSNSRMKGLKITLNGQELRFDENKLPYNKETSLGNLNFTDNSSSYGHSTLWVRMNGLAMFPYHLSASGNTGFDGYLELDGRSVDMLTSNRDSLSNQKGDELNAIFNTLANDREKLKLASEIDLTLNHRDVSLSDLDEDEQHQVSALADEKQMSKEEVLGMLKDLTSGLEAGNPFMGLAKKVKTLQKRMVNHIENIPANLYPGNFKVKHSADGSEQTDSHKIAAEISKDMRLVRNAKLAAGWKAIIEKLLSNEQYREMLYVEKKGDNFYKRDSLIQTGFVFGSPVGLNEHNKNENRISIMINPEFVLKEDLEVGDIIDIAHHELTHLVHNYHCEEFTIREMGLRRVTRKEIGDRALVASFKDAISSWRDIHSGKSANQKPKSNALSEKDTHHTSRSDYGMGI